MGGLSKVLKVITKRPKKSVMQEAQEGAKRAERGSKVKLHLMQLVILLKEFFLKLRKSGKLSNL